MKMISTIILILFLAVRAEAQSYAGNKQLPSTDRHSLSPAMSGYSGNTVLISDFYRQWTGMEGAPEHIRLMYAGPVNRNLHTALIIGQYKIGNFVNLNPSLSLANHIRISDQSKLLFGFRANYLSMQLNTANARGNIQNDPVLAQTKALKTKRLYFGAGVSWQYKNLTVGLFSEQLTGIYFANPYRYGEKIEAGLHLNYEYKINNSHELSSGALFYTIPQDFSNEFRFQTELLWSFQKKIFAGFSLNTGWAPGLSAGTALTDRILMFYSYGTNFNAPAAYAGGNHLIKLHFLIKRKRIPDSYDPFPISDSEKEIIRSEKMQTEYKDELEKLRQHFNKAIYEYDKRIEELEEKSDKKDF
jgi:type IX secretion system PorP/SprF family membrane protein